MWFALVMALMVDAKPSSVDASVRVITDPRESWAHRQQALERLRGADPKTVILAVLPWLPPSDREHPPLSIASAGPQPIDASTPFEAQRDHCVHELEQRLRDSPFLRSSWVGGWRSCSPLRMERTDCRV